MTLNAFDKKEYEFIINEFKSNGYTWCDLTELKVGRLKKVTFRHDIDVDLLPAKSMAEIEASNHITSSYFILLRSEHYNVFSKNNVDSLHAIEQMGHKIELHLDCSLYENYQDGYALEKELFYSLLGKYPNLVSFHRPAKTLLRNDGTLFDIPNTYNSLYIDDIDYKADSTGQWRYGHPLESNAFRDKKPMHVNFHPIWWWNGRNKESKVTNILKHKIAGINYSLESNIGIGGSINEFTRLD